MASSSVSQDDIDNDFEKNSRRSRIRTARARQINPTAHSGSIPQQQILHGLTPTTTTSVPGSCRLESTHGHHFNHHHHHANPPLPEDHDPEYDHKKDNDPNNDAKNSSPKALLSSQASNTCSNSAAGKKMNKLHHVNKGKQQRDRRKLREKRRSTGVVHLASTESTSGGSTTGDDDESSECGNVAGGGQNNSSCYLSSEITKRNTQHNESIHQIPSNLSNTPLGKSSYHHYWTNSNSSVQNSGLYPSSILRSRDKSTSDLEADDENDLDSMNNRSGSSSAFSSSNHLPELPGSSSKPGDEKFQGQQKHKYDLSKKSSNSTPVQRPTTPTGDAHSEQIDRVIEENKRLLSLMEEKDKKIHLLELQIQQLLKDSKSRSEEQSRLQTENSTLLRALTNITSAKK